MKLDDCDLKILEILQQDGRITKKQLADAVNLSASPAWGRLKRLEESGVIAGYHARIDPARLADATTVMVEIILARHKSEDFRRFEKAVAAMPQVVECLATGGGIDYMLRVVARDVDAYQRFMDELLDSEVGIDRYFSYIVTKTVKAHAGLPLHDLLQHKAEDSS